VSWNDTYPLLSQCDPASFNQLSNYVDEAKKGIAISQNKAQPVRDQNSTRTQKDRVHHPLSGHYVSFYSFNQAAFGFE